ncbi:MAG TPA: DUF2752 domain-containing protein [Ktedonobacterales bacterium]|nr:DUF2752 domain-containing protein [Ktedonobacterales bacterium]
MSNASLTALGKIGFFILLPLLAIFVPTAWLERRRSLCIIKNLTGHNCPGCGMTRAISSASHGHFTQAFRYNRLVVVVLPLLAYEWLKALTRATRSYRALRGR